MARSDGSLSNYAVQHGLRYINVETEERGSSPASRGGAGTYIEGELGAFYLLSMLADISAHGLPGAKIVKVGFQGTDFGYAPDALILDGASSSGPSLLDIQSKRDIIFAPRIRSTPSARNASSTAGSWSWLITRWSTSLTLRNNHWDATQVGPGQRTSRL